jgi:hypothetical protein
LVLPRYAQYEWPSVNRLAQKGHAGAAHALRHLWDPYKDQDIHCLLCEKQVAFPPHSQAIPEVTDKSKIAIVALCPGCGTMPAMPRINGILGMMKKMYAARRQV